MKNDVKYDVISGSVNLGYILNGKFYGTHYTERGPIDIDSDPNYRIEGMKMFGLKDMY